MTEERLSPQAAATFHQHPECTTTAFLNASSALKSNGGESVKAKMRREPGSGGVRLFVDSCHVVSCTPPLPPICSPSARRRVGTHVRFKRPNQKLTPNLDPNQIPRVLAPPLFATGQDPSFQVFWCWRLSPWRHIIRSEDVIISAWKLEVAQL